MLDIKWVREHPDEVRAALRRRQSDFPLEAFLEREQGRRARLTELEQQRSEQRKASEAFGRQQGAAGGPPPPRLKQLAEAIKRKEQDLKQLDDALVMERALMPNIPHPSVPDGDARANRIERTIGEPSAFRSTPKTHVELAEHRGWLDLARAAKITGSHFPLLLGAGARLERALIQWMLDVHTREHGYVEVAPPYLVSRASMFGTGQLPKFEEDMYRLRDDDLFLVPTAEVPLTNLHRDEILDGAQLPLAYAAYTPCFRREAGSYGKDTKGLVRVHQFDKVELVRFVKPETSYAALEELVGHAERILQRLGLHYRVVSLAAGDLGFAAAKCYDLEAWAPGLGQYLEVSSCSNFEAFQARRANLRYRDGAGGKPAYVHTLNGSGVALARTLICLLETHQQPDGRIRVPEPLRSYLHGEDLL